MKIGFTGTQRGMTQHQECLFVETIYQLLLEATTPRESIQFHHGDCIGADADAHRLIRHYFPTVTIVGHPPINESKRAFCKVDIELKSFDYLVRNRQIVTATDVLVACPGGMTEELRSGTWSTVRYARKQKGYRGIVLWPQEGNQ